MSRVPVCDPPRQATRKVTFFRGGPMCGHHCALTLIRTLHPHNPPPTLTAHARAACKAHSLRVTRTTQHQYYLPSTWQLTEEHSIQTSSLSKRSCSLLAAGLSAAAAARAASGQQQPQALQRRAIAGRRLSAPAAGGAADRGDGSDAEGDKWNERPTRNARRRLSMGAGPLTHGPLNPAPHVHRNEYGDASGDPYGCVIFWMLFSAMQRRTVSVGLQWRLEVTEEGERPWSSNHRSDTT